MYTQQQLGSILEELRREDPSFPSTVRVGRLIQVLTTYGRLRRVVVLPEHVSEEEHQHRELTQTLTRPRWVLTNPTGTGPEDIESERPYTYFPRFIWGDASPVEVALSLQRGSYLSHATAVYLHGLSAQIPRRVYVNKEQTPKPAPAGPLTQEGIDRAFARPARTSNFVFRYGESRLVLLNGKHTGDLEVSEVPAPGGPAGLTLRSTKLERTLIDITVRPTYAGGVFDVLAAYRGAMAQVSVPTVVATLARLGHMYPYHQAIGFYLQRAGAAPRSLERLRALGLTFDFYLANKMPEPQFDPTWRVFYPAGL